MKIEQEYRLALTAAEYDRLRTSLGEPLHFHRLRNHYFDTAAEDLRRRGFGLRLREQEGRYRLAWKGPNRVTAEEASGGISRRWEEEREIPATKARKMLAEGATLGEFATESLPGSSRLPAEIEPLRADRVRTIGWVETERAIFAISNIERQDRIGQAPARPGDPAGGPRPGGPLPDHPGDLRAASAGQPMPGEACLELDRVRFPGGRIEYELEVEWSGGHGLSLGQRLRGWLAVLDIAARPQPETKLARFFRYRAPGRPSDQGAKAEDRE
ncbi:MAG: CYTH domain-containing protein [Candidatus Eisenbacteria bacterium]|nr:CYTH domain-containing protein [Candidatus Eisenbacteria bacterium]